MTDTIARYKSGKLTFETRVDLDNAMKLKKGEKINISEIARDKFVYTDIKKGMKAGNDELINVFSTTDIFKIIEKIVLKGQIEVTQEFRDEAIENRKKQIIDFLSKNAIDSRTNRPYTADIISSALKEVGTKIENTPVEKQINKILESLKKIIPIKISSKRLKLKIPSQFTGQIYGLVNDYKEKEEWLNDGSLEVVINLPIGLQIEFYDKLNGVTHGSVLSEEIKE
jgi:ribosome maturation protein SDO1